MSGQATRRQCPITGLGVVRGGRHAVAIVTVALLAMGLAGCGSSGPANANTTTTVPPTTLAGASAGIASVSVQVIRTADGQVAYRELGTGTPLLLITGLGGSIDDWEPALPPRRNRTTRFRYLPPRPPML